MSLQSIVVVDETDTDTEEISDKDDAEEHHKVSLQSIVVVDETDTDTEEILDKDDAEEHHKVSLLEYCCSR